MHFFTELDHSDIENKSSVNIIHNTKKQKYLRTYNVYSNEMHINTVSKDSNLEIETFLYTRIISGI